MDIEKIKKANTQYLGKEVIYYEEVSSTQEEAKRIAKEGNANGTIVITDEQTRGKGTKGRVWYSSKGKNLTMTLILLPHCKACKLDGITIKIAEAMAEAIFKLYNIKLDIKHPNDLMLNNKKIAGILTEAKTLNDEVKQVLIGIGFNVNETDFNDETKKLATSLKREYGKEFCIEDIVVKFIETFEKECKL